MEIGATDKRARDGRLRVALIYPGTYKEAASSLGYLIVYDILNRDEDVVAHRFTLDSPFSIEEGLPLRAYDLILVSVHFEPQLPKLLSYLSRYGVKLRKEERKKPIAVGGPGVWNPLPVSQIADAVFVGDGEDTLREFLDVAHLSPDEWRIEGLYSTWNNEGTRFAYHDLSFTYEHVLSDTTAYGKMPVYLEVNRGCRFACRFCLIGWTRRLTNRRYSQVLRILESHFERGAEKVVFMGSDVLAYPHIDRLVEDLADFRIPFSIPSTRVDKLTDEFISLLARGGVRTLTIAPEAAHSKRKLFIAKLIDNEDVVDVARRASALGIRKLKLYFILGFPGTTEEEAEAIVKLVRDVRKHVRVEGTVSVFVPKPYTPFQFLPMERLEVTSKYLRFVKRYTGFHVVNPKRAALQAVLSVGDEKVSELLLRAYKNFNYHYWLREARSLNINIEKYLYGPRETPWMEKVKTYVPERAIKEGYERALEVLG